MLSFSTLDNLQPEQIIPAFNRAFADYVVPVRLTPAGLKQKMAMENLSLAHSIGLFDGPELVGLMLHGLGEWNGRPAAYNGGTGIWPEYRGQGLVKRMYDQLAPLLATAGAEMVLLEVIDTNKRAIRAYENTGFQPLRRLDCFKGAINYPRPDIPPGLSIHHNNKLPWEELPKFWNFQPSWQNKTGAARRGQAFLDFLSLRLADGQLLAYGVIQGRTGRVIQFGVHPAWRRQGLGRLLFFHLGRLGNPLLTVLNVGHEDEVSRAFLLNAGLELYLGQIEMAWRLSGYTGRPLVLSTT